MNDLKTSEPNADIACDVGVVSAGTAGFGAAIAAARAGLSVHLIEAGTKVGGVMAFCPPMARRTCTNDDEIKGIQWVWARC